MWTFYKQTEPSPLNPTGSKVFSRVTHTGGIMAFEKKIKELESIVEKMATGELSLEDSLKLFEKGTRLFQECTQDLNKSEQKVQELIAINKDGQPETKDFEMVKS